MSEPICIRRTATLEEAAIVVAWLAEEGVEAEIADPENPGVMAFGFTDKEGIAICVADTDSAARAKKLLTEHDRQRAASAAVEGVTVTCESCGTANPFGADVRGSVQQCMKCSAYMDVP